MTDRSAWTIAEVDSRVVAPLIRCGHYLHKMPAIATCSLLLTDGTWNTGALVWAMPPRETSRRYGHETWELARLWLSDVLPRNSETWFISRAVRHVKAKHPEICHLVSYADPSRGHRGTIYLAANWIEEDRTDSERKTPRFDYFFGTRKISRGKRAAGLSGIVRRSRVSKYRFSLCLDQQGCRLGEVPA